MLSLLHEETGFAADTVLAPPRDGAAAAGRRHEACALRPIGNSFDVDGRSRRHPSRVRRLRRRAPNGCPRIPSAPSPRRLAENVGDQVTDRSGGRVPRADPDRPQGTPQVHPFDRDAAESVAGQIVGDREFTEDGWPGACQHGGANGGCRRQHQRRRRLDAVPPERHWSTLRVARNASPTPPRD